jgi:hypothetical protein
MLLSFIIPQDNMISDVGGALLFDALKKNQVITQLKLERNLISEQLQLHIAKLLQDRHLREDDHGTEEEASFTGILLLIMGLTYLWWRQF